jgi:exodeoxyribonuclease VII small subunit
VPKKSSKPLNFESALSELESIVEKMEDGEITLEESLKHFERGIELTRTCQKALHDAEQKVQILLKKNGQNEQQPFEENT